MTSKEALEKLINDIINRTSGKGLPLKLVIDYDYLIPLLKDVKQDIYRLEKLEKENQELKEKLKILEELNNINRKIDGLATKTVQENFKLKQLIEKIKELPNCDICDNNWHKGCMCLQNKLKEVLKNE